MKKLTFYFLILFIFTVSTFKITNQSDGLPSEQQNYIDGNFLNHGRSQQPNPNQQSVQDYIDAPWNALHIPIRNLEEKESKLQEQSGKIISDLDSQDEEKNEVIRLDSQQGKKKKSSKKQTDTKSTKQHISDDKPQISKQQNTDPLQQKAQLTPQIQVNDSNNKQTNTAKADANIQASTGGEDGLNQQKNNVDTLKPSLQQQSSVNSEKQSKKQGNVDQVPEEENIQIQKEAKIKEKIEELQKQLTNIQSTIHASDENDKKTLADPSIAKITESKAQPQKTQDIQVKDIQKDSQSVKEKNSNTQESTTIPNANATTAIPKQQTTNNENPVKPETEKNSNINPDQAIADSNQSQPRDEQPAKPVEKSSPQPVDNTLTDPNKPQNPSIPNIQLPKDLSEPTASSSSTKGDPLDRSKNPQTHFVQVSNNQPVQDQGQTLNPQAKKNKNKTSQQQKQQEKPFFDTVPIYEPEKTQPKTVKANNPQKSSNQPIKNQNQQKSTENSKQVNEKQQQKSKNSQSESQPAPQSQQISNKIAQNEEKASQNIQSLISRLNEMQKQMQSFANKPVKGQDNQQKDGEAKPDDKLQLSNLEQKLDSMESKLTELEEKISSQKIKQKNNPSEQQSQADSTVNVQNGEKLKEFSDGMKKLEERMSQVQERLRSFSKLQEKLGQISKLEEKVNQVTKLEEKINSIEKNADEKIKESEKNLKKQLEGTVSQKSYNELLSRLSSLEALVQKMQKEPVINSQISESKDKQQGQNLKKQEQAKQDTSSEKQKQTQTTSKPKSATDQPSSTKAIDKDQDEEDSEEQQEDEKEAGKDDNDEIYSQSKTKKSPTTNTKNSDASSIFGLSMSELIFYIGTSFACLFLCKRYFFKKSSSPPKPKTKQQYNPSDISGHNYSQEDDSPHNRSVEEFSSRPVADNSGEEEIVSDRKFYKEADVKESIDEFGSFETRKSPRISANQVSNQKASISTWQVPVSDPKPVSQQRKPIFASTQPQIKPVIKPAEPTRVQTQSQEASRSIKPLKKPTNQSALDQFQKARIPDSFNQVLISNSNPYTLQENPISVNNAGQFYAVGKADQDQEFEEYSEASSNQLPELQVSVPAKKPENEQEEFEAFQEPHLEEQKAQLTVKKLEQNDEEFLEGQVISLMPTQDQPQITEELVLTTQDASKDLLLSGESALVMAQNPIAASIEIIQEKSLEDDDPFKDI